MNVDAQCLNNLLIYFILFRLNPTSWPERTGACFFQLQASNNADFAARCVRPDQLHMHAQVSN